MLVGSDTTDSMSPGGKCNVLDYVSKKFSTVTRSSFAAELRNQLEASQAGVYFSAFLQENLMPTLTAKGLADMQDEGQLKLTPLIMGDNDGVFRAVTSENPKTASEPILTPHVRAYREMLDKQQLGGVGWCDNRDMIADPLTKGKTRRNDLNIMLNCGIWNVKHSTLQWPVEAQGPPTRSRL